MSYTPIKCPSCGSGSIVPAEGDRIYCKSCDQFFEKAGTPQIGRELPTQEAGTPHIWQNEQPGPSSTALWVYYAILFLYCAWLVVLAHLK